MTRLLSFVDRACANLGLRVVFGFCDISLVYRFTGRVHRHPAVNTPSFYYIDILETTGSIHCSVDGRLAIKDTWHCGTSFQELKSSYLID